ncbi:hypothetical protein GIB67_011837 [Kingdonia uniflora]|uniref:Uncharacterized protein n=1 Tax=Kingdonia uniflora TaxID=39325 RepID=A0A7J7NXX3_9MAGN|nr:hypothetical protein GIB67_011837 [Kingdonia uniflora]
MIYYNILIQVRSSYLHGERYSTAMTGDSDTHDDFRPTNKVASPDLSLKDVVEQHGNLFSRYTTYEFCSIYDVQDVKENAVMIYMKGVPDMPQCGFSSLAVRVLKEYRWDYELVESGGYARNTPNCRCCGEGAEYGGTVPPKVANVTGGHEGFPPCVANCVGRIVDGIEWAGLESECGEKLDAQTVTAITCWSRAILKSCPCIARDSTSSLPI